MSLNRRRFIKNSFAMAAWPSFTSQLLGAERRPANDELWYDKPATRWLEALPVGNGRIGAMVYGGMPMERLALSESTIWSGAPETGVVNPDARLHLREIRELLFAGKYTEAGALCERDLLSHPKNFGTNLPLPELHFSFAGVKGAAAYRRSLDLDTAIARVSYRTSDALVTREVFASHPSEVLAIRFTSSKPRGLSFSMSFGDAVMPCVVTVESHSLVLKGDAFEKMHSTGRDGVRFEIHAQLLSQGGTVNPREKKIEVSGATSATVLIAIGSSFGNNNPAISCAKSLQRATEKSYEQLRQAHIVDYQRLYRRTMLDLSGSVPSSSSSSIPTDVRRKAIAGGKDDPELIALFFQYGRYLTIAGSRADSPLPLALQGIWNDGLASSMGWTDDFHLDINTQQNYWAAEVCNLGECQLPLFRLIEIMRTSGRTTAREMYDAPGWVVHTITNPWGHTAPGSGTGWGLYVTAGIWIALQLWEHYIFNPDLDFLRVNAYPVLKEAAEFFVAYMVPEPTHGWLVTGPSDSPENWYRTPTGDHAAESMGNTCDRAFVHALFSMCIEASSVLKVDDDLRNKWQAARDKLPPFQVGKHGQLQEWLQDFEDAVPNHRHTSHLVALYPLHQISPGCTPELARAAEVTLERRINAPHWEQTEWASANLIVYYARLFQGYKAYHSLQGLLAKATDDSLLTFSAGGVAGAEQNIFAIDGNMAGAAGIAEMLIQSQPGEIVLLPALPASWPTGTLRGVCARGGCLVDIRWRNGRLQFCSVVSNSAGSYRVHYRDTVKVVQLQAGQRMELRFEDFSSASIADAGSDCHV